MSPAATKTMNVRSRLLQLYKAYVRSSDMTEMEQIELRHFLDKARLPPTMITATTIIISCGIG